VDDHHVVRQGLVRLLRDVAGLEVAGEAAGGEAACERVLTLDPDVALLDIVMPEVDGIEATRRIRASHPRTEVVILTGHASLEMRRRAFEAGARGYLLKDCDLEQLVDCIRHTAHGDYYLPGAGGQDVVSEYVQPLIRDQKPGGVVTPREREIACLLADGYSTKEAAAFLNISVRTAETHRASIMRKLDAKNVADVVKYCIRNHLVDV
jgi:DNA-binding NarL/FixJ family response regulator